MNRTSSFSIPAPNATGGVVGVATAPGVLGPWTDRGAVLRTAPASVPESAFVLPAPDGTFVMTFNYATQDEKLKGSHVATGGSLLPLDGDKPPFGRIRPQPAGMAGWAHEWLPHPAEQDRLVDAYLTGYFVNLSTAWMVKLADGWMPRQISPGGGTSRVVPPVRTRPAAAER